jgi:hypothetical protein
VVCHVAKALPRHLDDLRLGKHPAAFLDQPAELPRDKKACETVMRSVTVQPTLSEPHRNLQHVLPGDLLILHAEDDLGDLWIRGEGQRLDRGLR